MLIQVDYDVVIVGASIAGCTAAALFARRGLRVALIERESDPQAYKKLCTHSITGVATPVIRELGLDLMIEAAGGLRNSPAIWSEQGWIIDPDHKESHGYNIRRQTFDPLIRQLAMNTEGVTTLLGYSAHELLRDGQQVVGVRVQNNRTKEWMEITAALVVGADGRHSRIAQLGRVKESISPNNRFGYFAHYRHVVTPYNQSASPDTHAQFWVVGHDVVYTFPNDDGVTVIACILHKDKMDTFHTDAEKNFLQFLSELPDAPDMRAAERISPLIAIKDLPNIYRTHCPPGLALIGDAAMASDPLWGTGCGWAIVSADWLVSHTADALRAGGSLNRALRAYERRHFRATITHRFHIDWFATGRGLNLSERIYFGAAAKNSAVARRLHAYGARRIGYWRLLLPYNFAQAVWHYLKPRPQTNEMAAATPTAGQN